VREVAASRRSSGPEETRAIRQLLISRPAVDDRRRSAVDDRIRYRRPIPMEIPHE
jgi:hypothetical protein